MRRPPGRDVAAARLLGAGLVLAGLGVCSTRARSLVADEPTGNLDDTTGERILALLERVTRREGRTLILVTHSPSVAARADRVFTIDGGHVVPLVPVGPRGAAS